MTHPEIAELGFLVGTWQGSGHGDYPTISSFDYDEDVVISALPKPVLAYQQRTRSRDDGSPLHVESGYIRLAGRTPELVICQPTGIVEAHTGTLKGQSVRWEAVIVATTPSARDNRMTGVRRELDVDGSSMHYRLFMGAAGQPLQLHLEATLIRVAD